MAEAKRHYLQRNPQQLRILAFGNSLTEGYCDFGTKFHPYGPKLQSELSKSFPDTKVTVQVNGLSGDRVLKSLDGVFISRLERALSRAATASSSDDAAWYDFIVLLGGTNDLAYTFGDPHGPAKIFEGLEECYDLVLQSGAALVCLTVPERFLDTKDNNMGRQGRAARLELNALIEGYVGEHESRVASATSVNVTAKECKVFVMDLASKMPFERVETEDGSVPEHEGFWSADGLHMTPSGYDNVGKELAVYLTELLKAT